MQNCLKSPPCPEGNLPGVGRGVEVTGVHACVVFGTPRGRTEWLGSYVAYDVQGGMAGTVTCLRNTRVRGSMCTYWVVCGCGGGPDVRGVGGGGEYAGCVRVGGRGAGCSGYVGVARGHEWVYGAEAGRPGGERPGPGACARRPAVCAAKPRPRALPGFRPLGLLPPHPRRLARSQPQRLRRPAAASVAARSRCEEQV